jgi:hypothetical protein
MSDEGKRGRDAEEIRSVLAHARNGGASMSSLARAHELAEVNHLPFATAEIRQHMRDLIPDPDDHPRETLKAIVLGVASGIATHLILRASKQKGHA